MPSTASSQVYVVVDLGSGLPDPLVREGDWYLGGTSIYPIPSLNVSFQGTEFRVFGYNRGSSQRFQVKLDSNTPYEAATDASPGNYQQWYQSPVLPDGQHTIFLDQLDDMGIDFYIVAPGPTTDLTNQSLIVDDTYTGIQYSSAWVNNTRATLVADQSHGGFTFMNTTHSTSKVGETMIFSFTGTTASVYGIMPWEKIGSFEVAYSLDGDTPSTQTFATQGTIRAPFEEQPNFKLIDTSILSPGKHNISLTLSACTNQTFIIDYIIYTPSFTTLVDANLTASPPSSPSTSTTTQTSPVNTDTTGTSAKTNVGAIAGGVVGGVLIIAIIIGWLIWILKKKRKGPKEMYDDHEHEEVSELDGSHHVINPYLVETNEDPLSPLRSPGLAIKPGMVSEYNSQSPSSATSPTPLTAEESTAPPLVPDASRNSESSEVNRSPGQSRPSSRDGDVQELRQRVHQLTAQVEHWQNIANPPAYTTT